MAYFRCGISNIQKFRGDAVDVADLPAPIASFQSNVSGVNLSALKVLVEAVQSGSGTPSPDNVRPITGWSGANVTRTGKNVLTMDYLQSGSISGSGSFINSPLRLRTSGSIYTMLPIKPSQVYTYSLQGAEGVTNLVFMEANEYSKDRVWLRNRALNRATGQYTPSADCYYVIFLIRKSDNSTIDVSDVDYLQVELGSTATAYEQYNGNTYTIAFGDTYYGGELDVTNGVLRVDKGMIKLSDLDWTGIASNPPVFRAVLSSIPNIQAPASNTTVTTAFTESFSAMSYTAITSSNIGKFAISATVSNRVVFIDDSVATLEAFLTKYGNDKLVYPLATPIEIQLTPTQIEQLLGDNNVFADCGDVEEVKKIQISQIGG